MTDEIETVNLPTTLPALTEAIRTHLNAGRRSAIETAEHMLEAGRLLNEAKRQVGHGNWSGWLQTNFGLGERTARGYMKLAREGVKSATVAEMGLRTVLRELAKPAAALQLPAPAPEPVTLSSCAFDIAQRFFASEADHHLLVDASELRDDVWFLLDALDKRLIGVMFHPLSQICSMMTKDEFPGLLNGMRKRGFMKERPITRAPNGQILDGRQRYIAALIADVEPIFEEFSDKAPVTGARWVILYTARTASAPDTRRIRSPALARRGINSCASMEFPRKRSLPMRRPDPSTQTF